VLDQIVRKIDAELKRGIDTECQVVYLLVAVRKLLDKEPDRFQHFKSLAFYCDWVVHNHLSRNKSAQDMVERAATLAAHWEKPDARLEAEFEQIFSLNAFREDLSQFLEKIGLVRFSDSQWNRFLACFLNVIEDCPLLPPASKGSVVDEVVIVGMNRAVDGSPPVVVWALCSEKKMRMTYGGSWEEWEEEVEAAVDQFYKSRE